MNTPGQVSPPPSPNPRNETLAVVSLVCGIASIILCLGPLTGIVAIICGHIAYSRIAKSAGALGGTGMALTGMILGYASFVLVLLLIPLLPAINVVRVNARRMEAKNTIMQLLTATKNYRAEYNRWPLNPAEGGTDLPADNGALLDVLRGLNTRENPRKIIFFEARTDQFRSPALVDPWGHPYRIVLDTNGDGQINVGRETVDVPVAIWSIGKNGRDEAGGGDDVVSWRPRINKATH